MNLVSFLKKRNRLKIFTLKYFYFFTVLGAMISAGVLANNKKKKSEVLVRINGAGKVST
jgi:hypothetical protein